MKGTDVSIGYRFLGSWFPGPIGTQEPIPDRYISTLHVSKLLCLIIMIIHDDTYDLIYGPSTTFTYFILQVCH